LRKLLGGILILLFGVLKSLGQGWVVQENTFETNWNMSFQLGPTVLLSEIHSDFSGATNDMNNYLDLSFNFQLGKMVWERFDLGIEIGRSNFRGFKNNPSDISWLTQHPTFNNQEVKFQPYAIYFDSDITNFSIYAKYNFINFSTWARGFLKLNMFVRLSAGLAYVTAETAYSDMASYNFTRLSHPLYAKGRYGNTSLDLKAILIPTFGLNYQISERFFVSGELSMPIIATNNLDGIINYNNLLSPETPLESIEQYRIGVFGLSSKFMVGLTYFFNFDTRRQNREKILPFYSNMYRAYYSKFHRPSSKRIRQERLPFFNEKL